MYWPVLAAIALAVGYYQVGVSVLSISLKAVLLVVAVAGLAAIGILLRRRFAR